MHLGIKKATQEFELWLGFGENEHEEVLAEIKALFDEHSTMPYNDYLLDAVHDFKVSILDRAIPGWRNEASTWGLKEVGEWYHDQVNRHGTKFLLLGIIRERGAEHLRDTLQQFTPGPIAAVSTSPAP